MNRKTNKELAHAFVVVMEKAQTPVVPGAPTMPTEEAVELVVSGLRAQIESELKGTPVPMLLYCPECGARHIDEGEFATKVHHTHSCQICGLTWRPARVPTVGVRFIPGFKNGESAHG